jgi:hypothetical protein
VNVGYNDYTIASNTLWQFVTAIWNDSSNIARLYVNAREAASGYNDNHVIWTDPNDTVYIGGPGWSDTYFKGYIDDVRLYTRALSTGEIDSLYHEGGYVGVEGHPAPTAPKQAVWLLPARPNPSRTKAEINYQLPKAGPVAIELYNVAGARVVTLVRGLKSTGHHTITWDLKDGAGHRVANGVYILRLTSGALSNSIKITVIR